MLLASAQSCVAGVPDCAPSLVCCSACELLPGCLETLLQFRSLRTLLAASTCTGLTPEEVVAVAKQVQAQGRGPHLWVWLREKEDEETLKALVKQEGLADVLK